jgi:hypothetical protein
LSGNRNFKCGRQEELQEVLEEDLDESGDFLPSIGSLNVAHMRWSVVLDIISIWWPCVSISMALDSTTKFPVRPHIVKELTCMLEAEPVKATAAVNVGG